MTRPFYKFMPLALLTAVGCFFFLSGTSSAATISPASGLDGLADDATCTLSEAITSINDGNNTTYDECTNTGDAFGTTDTIILPANPIILTADLPGITESLTIQGQGMDVSVIDGDNGQYRMFGLHGVGTDFAIDGLTLSGSLGVPIQDNDSGLPSEVLNFSASRLEIDGTNMAVDGGSAIGINLFAFGGATRSYSFDDVYIHDLSAVADGTVAGILVGAANTTVNVTEERVTISNLRNTSAVAGTQGLNFLIGPFAGMVGGTVNANISNATITNISAENGSASGVAALGMTANGDANINISIRNSTIAGLDGVLLPSYPVPSSAISAAGISFTDSQVSNISVDISNVVFAGNLHEGSPNNCEAQNLNSVAGGTGEVNATITSTGGNLSDDNSCAPYFTQPTDQNNVAGLAATLSALADNGGSVPTMALKQGSPAIDSGITIAGLTTDARGQARPQGSAYDSGAYESPYTKPTLAASGQGLNPLLVVSSLVAVALSVRFAVSKRQYVLARTR